MAGRFLGQVWVAFADAMGWLIGTITREFYVYKLLIILLLLLPAKVVSAVVFEVAIHGMTCTFCVEGLYKELSGLPDVARVDVSLKLKRVRLVSKRESLDMERVHRAIIDAGFTPVDTQLISSEEK